MHPERLQLTLRPLVASDVAVCGRIVPAARNPVCDARVVDTKSRLSYLGRVGLIVKRLRVAGDKGERRLDILFDTGASASFIRRDVAESIATILKLPSPETYTLGDGVGKLRVNETVVLYIDIGGVRISDNFIVARRLSDQVIIGATTLQKWRVRLDLEKERVIIDKRMSRLLLA